MRDQAKQATASPSRRRGHIAPALLCLAAFFTSGALTAAPAGAVDNVPFQGAFCEPSGLGSAPCSPQFTKPQSLAIDPASGDILVADIGDEVQRIQVSATAGEFRLSFGGDTTGDILYNADTTAVENILELLGSIGSVKVSGGPGDAAGSKPYVVTFQGDLGGTDVEQLGCEDGTTPLSGGSGCSATTITPGAATTVSRFNPDGTPAPFTALGTNAIDGKLGPEGKPCAEEPSSCDDRPGNLGIFGDDTAAKEVQIAVAPPGAPGGTSGNVYVTNSSNHLIDIFAADGHYLGQITKYLNGSSEERPLGEACGVAVDQSGTLYVGDYGNGVHKYLPSANPPLAADGVPGFVGRVAQCTLAAGAGPTAGLVLAADWSGRFVSKLDSGSGAQQCLINNRPQVNPPPPPVTTVTTDPLSGHLFVVRGLGADQEVAEYDGSCPPEPTVDAEVLSVADLPSMGQGAAFDPATSHLFVSREGSANVEIYGEPVTLPVALTLAAAPIGETGATLNGTVDPEGTEPQECSFEYLSEAEYEQNQEAEVDPFAGAASVGCAESPAEIGSGEEPVSVHAEVSGLGAGAVYHFRLRAKNAGGTDTGADRSFATRALPLIEDAWVVSASHEEATLRAQINPRHYATTYRVEYGPEGTFTESTAEVNVGSDDSIHTLTAILGGLKAKTTYSWRVVATSENGSSTSEPGSLTTHPAPAPPAPCANDAFRSGPSAGLPDCRAYELVSPVDKSGGDIVSKLASGYRQASFDGERITYTSSTSFGDADRGAFANQYIATRGAGGWSSHGINPPQGTTVFDAAGIDVVVRNSLDLSNGFHTFTPDLCFALMQDQNLETLAPESIHGYTNAYRRDNCGAGAEGYEAITRGDPPTSLNPEYKVYLELEMRNLTPDLGHAVFSSNAALTPDAAHALEARNQLYIYDFAEEELRLLSVLPGGKGANKGDNSVGTGEPRHDANLTRAVAEDGSRVFWTGFDNGFRDVGGSLYVRVNPGEEQSALDGEGNCTEADKACTVAIFEQAGSTRARFWTADTDGSTAIYSVGDDLFEFDVESEASSLIAGEVGGVAGASESLSHLYFTSKEAIAGSGQNERGEEAQAGEWNLYLRQGGAISFIATLAAEDRGRSIDSPFLREHSSRVSPDGRHLAFMSVRPLSGYDNSDAASGEADREVFLYDADTADLICASCNPSGAQPAGRNRGADNAVNKRWFAAWIRPWEWSNYAARSLSDNGNRLFFNAIDALVPADTNNAQDVYQWEAPGTGSCDLKAPSYFAQNEGCVSLISTGRNASDSEFVDASANGADVFISTDSSIDPRDPGLIDIYDARVGGGYPPPPPEKISCGGDACQSVPAPPNDPTPASAAFRGPGDPKPAAARKPRRCAKGKRKAIRRGKARCVSTRKHRANHNRRTAR